jgi:hypothetical protein
MLKFARKPTPGGVASPERSRTPEAQGHWFLPAVTRLQKVAHPYLSLSPRTSYFVSHTTYSTSTAYKLRTIHQKHNLTYLGLHPALRYIPSTSRSDPTSLKAICAHFQLNDRIMGGGNVCYDLFNICPFDVFNVRPKMLTWDFHSKINSKPSLGCQGSSKTWA